MRLELKISFQNYSTFTILDHWKLGRELGDSSELPQAENFSSSRLKKRLENKLVFLLFSLPFMQLQRYVLI